MTSIWNENAKISVPTVQSFRGELHTDVLVVGGGIAGILCAHKLKETGMACVVVEKDTILSGNSGRTTAKVTAQHGLIYDKLIRKMGAEKTARYYLINQQAVKEYQLLAKRIPCRFEEKTAYVYSVDQRAQLEREASAYQKLGIPHHFLEAPPLPFPTAGALGMEGQAQFHPVMLLTALARELEIFEHTPLLRLDGHTAITPNGRITANHIVLATHFPLINIPGLYFMKQYQHRSYVLALKNGPDLGGMYIDEDKMGLSFRNFGDFLLLGGGAHKTGRKGGRYEELRQFSAQAYPGCPELYCWSAQDCMTLDGVPYIGRHRKAASHLYVATGFNKWGMTGAMAAAGILTELITTGHSEQESLFSPGRSMMSAQLPLTLLSALGNLLKPGRRCPHMGCALSWNPEDRTWECPCHGSRFDREGTILDNPAKRGLHIE